MRIVPYDYRPNGGYGACQRCGFKFRMRDLKREWSGLLVCDEDWDPLPDTFTPPVVYPEGLPLPDTSPEPPNEFIAANVTAADL